MVYYQIKLFILVKRLPQNRRHNYVSLKFTFRSYHRSIFKTSVNYTIVSLICSYNNYSINHEGIIIVKFGIKLGNNGSKTS